MLAACTGIPSAESQCVRDCCHLEGETPVEIRIAVHRRKQPKMPSMYDQWNTGGLYHGSIYPPEGVSKLRDVGPTAGYADPFDGGKYGAVAFPGEPQMPKLMYTYESKRDVDEGDGFNPDTFLAPTDDSERAPVQRAGDSKLLPSSDVLKALSGEGRPPQVDMALADLDDMCLYDYGSTPTKSSQSRSDMYWTPGSLRTPGSLSSVHAELHPPEPRAPRLREGPMDEEGIFGAPSDAPFAMLERLDHFRECAPLVRTSSGIFTPVTFGQKPPRDRNEVAGI